MAKTLDPPLGGQRLGKGLAQNNARVLYGVVAVHLPVAYGFHLEAKVPVDGKGAEHVVKKADTGRNFCMAGAIQVQPDKDIGFLRFAGEFCFSHRSSHHLPQRL